jgi:hypothetical protein
MELDAPKITIELLVDEGIYLMSDDNVISSSSCLDLTDISATKATFEVLLLKQIV